MTRQQPNARTVRLADLQEGDYLADHDLTVTAAPMAGHGRVRVQLEHGYLLVGYPNDMAVVL